MGVVRATWAALPHLEASGGGAVLNISSISGIGPSGNIPYGAVKAAVIQLTQSHALAYSKQRIRVNCIAPGSIEFPRSEEHTSELQSLMRISYAVLRLKK